MNKKDYRKVTLYFLLSRIIFVLFLLIELKLKRETEFFNFYDAENYLNIAKIGYINDGLYAFFPLYPLLIRLLAKTVVSYEIAGLIISNICAYGTIILMYKLSNNSSNILKYIVSPILIFTCIIYTESLFIFLNVLTYYLYKKNKYFLTAVVAGLTILTRNSGFVILLVIGIDILLKKYRTKEIKVPIWKIIMYALVACLIGSIYPLYLFDKTGDLLYFMTVQNTLWGREIMGPIKAIYYDFKVLSINDYNPFLIYTVLLNWLSYLYALIMGIKLFKNDKISSLFLLISVFLLGLSFRDVNYWNSICSISLFRYIWGLFPLYLNNLFKSNVGLWLLVLLTVFNSILFFFNYFLA